MGTTKVYVIVDFDHYTKDQVWKEIIEEGYAHHFYFGNEKDQPISIEHLETADEVWCWGDCTLISDYIMAKEYGSDIWRMG